MLFDDGRLFELLLEVLGLETYFEKFGDVLKRALIVGRTGFAVHIMDRKKQLKPRFLKAPYRRGIGMDLHWSPNLDGTGGNGLIHSLDLYETEPARSRGRCHFFQMAQVRYINTVIQAGMEQIRSRFCIDLGAINGKFDHLRSLLVGS